MLATVRIEKMIALTDLIWFSSNFILLEPVSDIQTIVPLYNSGGLDLIPYAAIENFEKLKTAYIYGDFTGTDYYVSEDDTLGNWRLFSLADLASNTLPAMSGYTVQQYFYKY